MKLNAAARLAAKPLTTQDRDKLPDYQFGLPNVRKYPMPDKEHAGNAKGRAKQMLDDGKLSKSDYDKVVRKADQVLRK